MKFFFLLHKFDFMIFLLFIKKQPTQHLNEQKHSTSLLSHTNTPLTRKLNMVCSHCNGLVTKKHNKRTCPIFLASQGGCAPCKPVEKKERKVLEGLEGCKNIWKEPRDYYKVKKNNTQCSFCRGVGHNSRTCPLMCAPCVLPTGETASKAEVRAANTLALLFV